MKDEKRQVLEVVEEGGCFLRETIVSETFFVGETFFLFLSTKQ